MLVNVFTLPILYRVVHVVVEWILLTDNSELHFTMWNTLFYVHKI